MSENDIAKSLNSGATPELALQQTSVARQVATQPTDYVGSVIRENLQAMYRERAIKREEQKKQDVVNQKLKGSTAAMVGSNLPEDAGRVARDAYNSTSFMKETIPLFQEYTASFASEDFKNAPKEEQDEILQELFNNVQLRAQEMGLSDNTAVLEYLNTQAVNLSANADAAVSEYLTETLPARTISNLFDTQRESVMDPAGTIPDDAAGWKSIFDASSELAKEVGMSEDSRRSHIYGEVARMLDSGDVTAFNALRESDMWGKLTTEQKNVLDKGASSVMATHRKNSLDAMVFDFKNLANQFVATGDSTQLDDMMQSFNQLPDADKAVVLPKISKTYNDAIDFKEVIERGDARMQGFPTDTVQGEDANKYFKFLMRKNKLRTGEDKSTQQVAQETAMQMAENGIYSADAGNFFNITNPVFQEGTLDVQTVTAIDGIEQMEQRGFSPRQIESVIGKDSASLFQHYRSMRRKNLNMNSAMAAALEYRELQKNKPEGEKFEKVLDTVTSREYTQVITDGIASVFDWYKDQWPIRPMVDFAEFTNQQFKAGIMGIPESDGGNLVARMWDAAKGSRLQGLFEERVDSDGRVTAQYEDPNFVESLFMNATEEANVSNNRLAVANAVSQIARDNPLLSKKEQLDYAKRIIQHDSVVANGALITDEQATQRLRNIAGDTQKASHYTTQAVQVAAMFSTIDPATRDEIMSSFYDYFINGEPVDVSTEAGLRRLQNATGKVESFLSMERLQRAVVEGVKVGDKEFPALRDNLPNLAGSADATGSVFNAALWHNASPVTRTRYLKETDSLYIEVLDHEGNPLTTDKDLFLQKGVGSQLGFGFVNQEDQLVLPKNSLLQNEIPLSFIEDFIKASQASTFN